jgi:uncharacterized protein
MTATDLSNLTAQVLGFSFALSFLFGALAQRTHFCTMGAVSDIVAMGSWTRMRQWALAIAVAMLGFAALSFAGAIDASKTLYAAPRILWLSAILGGVMFGFGMVLASGCGSKTLVRVGTGNLKSLVVFVVMGVAAFATLKGITGVFRAGYIDPVSFALTATNDLPSLLVGVFGGNAKLSGLVCAAVIGVALLAWCFKSAEFRSTENIAAGALTGAIVVAMWWISGKFGFVAEHPDTLEAAFLTTNSGRMEAMSFVAPVAYTLDWLMFFSDKSKVLSFGMASVAGVVLGSFVMATVSREFRWEGFRDAEDTGTHLIGAVLMGVGGVMAMGCTVGQGLSGVSTLSIMSVLALACIIVGAVAALKWQLWRMESAV